MSVIWSSNLAMISSIPQKFTTNGNIKSKEAKVISSNATPKTKVNGKESSVPKKALTERKKQVRSPAAFRSVQNPKHATAGASKNRVVAKALVFQSPKKVVKLKRSVELSSSVKKICSGIRKLEIEKKRNVLGYDHKVGTSVAPSSRKPLKRRKVKSRVFDSLRLEKHIGDKSNCHGALKKKVKGKDDVAAKEMQIAVIEEKENASNAAVIDREDPAVIKESGVDKMKLDETAEIEDKENTLPPLKCDDKENTTNVDREDPAVVNGSRVDAAKLNESTEMEDKENVLPLECDDKENAAEIDRESDDKENTIALDNNRKVERNPDPAMKKKISSKKETFKSTQKAMTIADKCFNGKTVSASTRVKYTKPKLTNPKPFRLRTDVEENTRGNVPRGTSKKLVRHNASENMVNSKRVTSRKMASKRIETVDETSPRNRKSKEVSSIDKPSVCILALGERRPATVPKGPNFHNIHVPKSCTKRLASQV